MTLGSGLAGILFSGMAWVLVDIANAVAPEPRDLPNLPPDASVGSLTEIMDKELHRLSHNTSRALPEYKAIMDEIARRKGKQVGKGFW